LRTMARHNGGLSYRELVGKSSELLAPDGFFTIIIPTTQVQEITEIANEYKLHKTSEVNIITAPGKMPKRTLLTFGFSPKETEVKELLVEQQRNVYSDEFISLMKDYYLKM